MRTLKFQTKTAPNLEFRADGTLPPYVGGSPDEITSLNGSPFVISVARACRLLGTSKKRQTLLRGFLDYREALRNVGVKRGLQLIAGSMTENRGAEPHDVDITTIADVPASLRDALALGTKRLRFEELRDARLTKSEFGVDGYLFATQDTLKEIPRILRMFNLYSHSKSQSWKGVVAVDMRSDDGAARLVLEQPPRALPDLDAPPIGRDPADEVGRPELVAYETSPMSPFAISPGRARESAPWARCLPMNIAEAWGWDVTIHEAFEATWSGKADPKSLTITGNERVMKFVASHFGHGIFSVRFPFLMRTPRGWNLQVRGPVNRARPEVVALEGMVETDWSVAPFTFNWRFLEPNRKVRFEAGDIIGRIVPVQRGRIEAFNPLVQRLQGDRGLTRLVRQWNEARASADHETGSPTEYRKGEFGGKTTATDHQSSLQVQPFRRVEIPT